MYGTDSNNMSVSLFLSLVFVKGIQHDLVTAPCRIIPYTYYYHYRYYTLVYESQKQLTRMNRPDPLAEALHNEKRRQRNGSLAKFSNHASKNERGNAARQKNGLPAEVAEAIANSMSRKRSKSQIGKKPIPEFSSIAPKRKGPCSFCGMENAAVSVHRSLTTIELCLLHYYTTSAVLIHNVTIYNKAAFREQLPYVQSLFERSVTQLMPMLTSQQNSQTKRETKPKVQHDTKTASADPKPLEKPPTSMMLPKNPEPHTHDPLSLLLKRTKKNNKNIHKPKINLAKEGGFIRSADASQTERNLMQKHALMSSSGRKCIWNLAMDSRILSSSPSNKQKHTGLANDGTKCQCGSDKVECQGNITCRNNDIHKAETWGVKRDVDQIITRYRCLSCAKVWNQED